MTFKFYLVSQCAHELSTLTGHSLLRTGYPGVKEAFNKYTRKTGVDQDHPRQTRMGIP